jgi:hypothetical protein
MRYSISDAMIRLRPNSKFIIINETQVIWNDYEKPQPSEEEIQAKIAELEAAEPMRLLRLERDRLIQQTDWRFRSDLTPSQEWIDYCQALRDLPANSEPQLDENGNLTNVNWPVPPGE